MPDEQRLEERLRELEREYQVLSRLPGIHRKGQRKRLQDEMLAVRTELHFLRMNKK